MFSAKVRISRMSKYTWSMSIVEGVYPQPLTLTKKSLAGTGNGDSEHQNDTGPYKVSPGEAQQLLRNKTS